MLRSGSPKPSHYLRTGVPCGDQVGLLNVLLAEGLNLGLRKMAEATNTHDYWQLSRLARWHVESDAMDQALAIVVAAQAKLPMSRFWGIGTTASSDGQALPFGPAGRGDEHGQRQVWKRTRPCHTRQRSASRRSRHRLFPRQSARPHTFLMVF